MTRNPVTPAVRDIAPMHPVPAAVRELVLAHDDTEPCRLCQAKP